MKVLFAPIQWLSSAVSQLMIGMVRIYQITLSPLLGNCCRFTPSCSQYFIDAVKKYGPIRGGFKGAYRIIRCNPFSTGGIDPP
ncbi:MAG TPA: membrane protein insertion efficiency factor YidD [Planctomycetaceae bacterium]|jgi:putative membrane protein insertion efficiency factor|nr:membrane protein insertion efficiency factor YidD [Rhodopirellula sp.]MCH2362505.1 membrane protein insertion efficiency factor YidD [Pirellulales bacterium]HAL13889.1 membrane protein insertion efficiency factor YidD [Planctomycetaceae bacterium]HCK71619.1 membrane protein insertion efficiency factor YidD [Planctomycetaceae bacterium]HCP83900.1 membrane protein insertion efficiency factor YidD [Planctomycetaceae bacterium]|tara:strand:- start:1423 stop:1671 length:249 start_codon:yes stop_codon:yes gene_type:complete